MKKDKTIKIEDLSNTSETKQASGFLVIAFLIAYLLITFLPKGMSIDIMGIQWLYISIINVVIGIIIYFFKKDEIEWSKFYLNKVTLLYIAFVALSGISVFFGDNQIEGIVSYIKLLSVFCAFLLLSITSNTKKSVLLNFSIAISIIFFYEMFMVASKFYTNIVKFDFLVSSQIVKGNSGNVNIMASTIMLKLPFVLYCYYYFKNKKQYFFLITFFLGTLVLFPTGSRTNIISYFLLLVFIISFIIYTKQFKIFKTKIILFLLTALVGYGVSYWAINKHIKKKKTETTDKVIEKKEDINEISGNRLTLWNNTIQLIKKEPLTGVGYGNYKIEVLPFESKQRDGWRISKYSHEDFLQVCAESGILTGLLYLSLFIITSFICFKRILNKNLEKEKKWLPFVVLMLLMVYVIDSLLNFPLHVALTQVHFLIILFFFLNLENDKNSNTKYINSNYVIAFATVLSAILVIPNYKYFKSLYGQNTVFADEKAMKLSYDKVDEVLPNYPNLNEFGYTIASLKAKYLIKEKRYDEALELLMRTKNDNKYIMYNENLVASIYGNYSNYDSVYKYRKMAFEMYPKVEVLFTNYILTLKKLNKIKELDEAKLYHDKYGSNEKFDSIFNRIYNHNGKIILNKNEKAQENPINVMDKNLSKTSEADQKKKLDYIIELSTKLNNTKNDWKKRLEISEELKKLQPESIIHDMNIGMSLYKLSRPKEAKPFIEKSIKSNYFTDGLPEFVMGCNYLTLNDKSKGCEYLSIAKTKGYTIPENIQANCK